MAQEQTPRLSLLSLILWPFAMLWRLINGAADWFVQSFRGLSDVFTGGPVPDEGSKPKVSETKRNTAWAFATVAGVLALLLLLAWQIHGLLSEETADDPADLRLADTSATDNFGSPLPPAGAGRKKPVHGPDNENPPLLTIDPPPGQIKQVAGNLEPALGGSGETRKSPDDPYGFGVEPKKGAQTPPTKTPEAPVFNFGESKTVGETSPKKSPFESEPGTGGKPDGKTEPRNPIAEKSGPELKFPGSEQPANAKTTPKEPDAAPKVVANPKDESPKVAEKQPPFSGFDPQPEKKGAGTFEPKKDDDRFAGFEPAKKAIVVSPAARPVEPNAKHEPPLSLEVVRNDDGREKDGSNFIVTSLSGNDEAAMKLDRELPEESIGWKAVRWDDDAGAILPVRYTVPAALAGNGGTRLIRLGSTAALSLTVGTPQRETGGQLTYQIITIDNGHVGETVPLRLLITNTGDASLENVAVHVDLPAEMKYHVGRKLEHTIRRLAPGRTHVARLTPTAVKPGIARIIGKAIVNGRTVRAVQSVTIGTRTASRGAVTTSTNRTERPQSPGCCGRGVLR